MYRAQNSSQLTLPTVDQPPAACLIEQRGGVSRVAARQRVSNRRGELPALHEPARDLSLQTSNIQAIFTRAHDQKVAQQMMAAETQRFVREKCNG